MTDPTPPPNGGPDSPPRRTGPARPPRPRPRVAANGRNKVRRPGRPGAVVTRPTVEVRPPGRSVSGGAAPAPTATTEPTETTAPTTQDIAAEQAVSDTSFASAPSPADGVAPANSDAEEPIDAGSHNDAYDDQYGDHDVSDDDYVDLPPEGRIPRWAGVLLVFALLLALVIGGGAFWYKRQLDPPGGPGETVSINIPRGASLSGIGGILEGEGVIPNSLVFNFYASRKGAGPYDAGVYQLKQNSSVDLVLDTMAEGPTGELSTADVARVTIPEGLTTDEIVARAAGQVPRFEVEKLSAALEDNEVSTSLRPDGQDSYEGMLFPATYEVGGSETELEFLDTLASEMETRVGRNDLAAAQARIKAQFGIDVTEYELLTVASLVQAEAGNAEEASKIATVIYNRLAADTTQLTLGIDAVDEYGANLAGTDIGTFRETAQPYNTRVVKGLPPTPISAPGDFALNAAFEPEDGPWTYYVLTDPGVHSFAVSKAEFDQFKQVCVEKNLGCG